MDLIASILRDTDAFDPHKRAGEGITISEMYFREGFSLKPLLPIGLDFPVFDFFDA